MPSEKEIVDCFEFKYFNKLMDIYESIEKDCHLSTNILNDSNLNINIKSDFMDLILYSIKSNSIFKK